MPFFLNNTIRSNRSQNNTKKNPKTYGYINNAKVKTQNKYKLLTDQQIPVNILPLSPRYSFKNKQISFDRKLSILIRSNNIFCNLRNLKKKKTILARSRGKYRIRISRKLLKHSAVRVLKEFCKEAKNKLTQRGLFISLVAPIKLRDEFIEILKTLRSFKLKNDKKKYFRPLIIKLNDKKCFNGCRSAKRKRKKRISTRLKK